MKTIKKLCIGTIIRCVQDQVEMWTFLYCTSYTDLIRFKTVPDGLHLEEND